jgi:hypothetical protein
MFLFVAAASSSSSGFANSLGGVIALVVIAAVISALLGKGAKQKKAARSAEEAIGSLHFDASEPPLAYQVRPSLLTKAERSFYGVLRQALRDEWAIFAKVRISDIVTVPRGVAGWQTQFNKVQSKHVDFAVCDPATLRVVAAVELDDASHRKLERQERDAFVEAVFATAKLPLIRVPVKQAYTLESVRSLLSAHLPKGNEATGGVEEIEEPIGDERFAGNFAPRTGRP